MRDLFAFDFEVFMHDWLVVFRNDLQTFIFHNDPCGLKDWIETEQPILVGFNNYNYDDNILDAIVRNPYVLTSADVYNVSQNIITYKQNKFSKLPILTLDVRQELPLDLSLKAIEAYLGMDIVECDVPWTLDRPLTKEELENVTKYCIHDVDATYKIYFVCM